MAQLENQSTNPQDLQTENKELRLQLKEARDIISAIRDGEVDALLVSADKKDQVYILHGADYVYREIIEKMQEGYVTLSKDGVILFCNYNFAQLVHSRFDEVIGSSIYELLPQSETEILLQSMADQKNFKREFTLAGKEFSVPVLVSVNFREDKELFAYMIITDLTEQKRNEQRFMHRVFDQAGEAIIVCDMTGKIIRVNSSATKVFGPGLLQKLFAPTLQLCRERDGKPFSVLGALHRGKTSEIEARYTCRDGRTLSFLVSVGWLTGSNPVERIGFLVTLGDITQRRLAEQALAESEERFRSLVENAKDIIYSMTPEGCFTYVSPNWTEALGHEVDELLGCSFADFVHSDDRPGCYELLERFSSAGDHQGVIEHRAWHKNGGLRWYSSNASAVFNDSGEIVSIYGVAHDITERKRMEEELRASQARYYTLMEQSFEAWALVDCQTREVVEINRRFTELLGYSLPEDAPLYNYQCVEDSQQNFDRYYNETLKHQRFLPTEVRIYRHKNGTHVTVERGGSVVSIGGRDYLMVSLRDMTAERARQAEMARDVEIARQVQQGLLPELPDSAFVTVRTLYHPSHFVSGDSYHLEWLNDGHLLRGFLVDISGHGLATALQTASVSVLLREAMTANASLLEQMLWVNMRSAKYFTDGSYAAILGFELDFSASELRYAGAGITMFLANGKKITTPGMFVGLWDNPKFSTGSLAIMPGDTFYFLTDGFTDALDEPENIALLSSDGKAFDEDVAVLEQLAERGTLRDDATGICLKIKDYGIKKRIGI
jgi:PAS domain S-box-containing protein